MKSLENVGAAISGDHIETVKNCFQERDNPTEVRVTALKVFKYLDKTLRFWELTKTLLSRSIPCHVRGNAAMKILEDYSEDSEIRITAYLVVMKCVDYHTILKVRDLLDNEEVNQGIEN